MNRLEIVILLCIIMLAGYLRLHRVSDNPGWYTDEGTHVDIAQNILEGRTQYLAVNQSTLLFARLPLFEYSLAGMMQIFGTGIGTLRLFTGLLGSFSVVLTYFVIKRINPAEGAFALTAAFTLAIYPQAVLYSRFGFSYNLLSPLVLLTCMGLLEYWRNHKRRWLFLATGCVGIGLISDLMMGSLIFAVILFVFFRKPVDLLWSVPVMLLPFGVYTVWMLLTVPEAFLFDLNYTLFRLNTLNLLDQIENIGLNYTTLISQDVWILAGIIGLLMIPDHRFRLVCLMLLFIPVVILGRTVALYHLSFYYIIPLLPLITLGMVALLRYGGAYAYHTLSNSLIELTGTQGTRPIAALIILLIAGIPLLHSLDTTIKQVRNHYPTAIDGFLVDPQTAHQVANFINERTTTNDVVIASPAIAWMIHAGAADFQMSIAYQGIRTVHMPANMDKDRFVFNADYKNARFVVTDSLWYHWGAVHMPEVAAMLRDVETWPLAFTEGSLKVYQNPN